MPSEDAGRGSLGAAGFDVFAADAEVGRDLARVDWAVTPLGPPSEWPQSLLTAVSILLSSRFSMWMAWGPELTFFCNAAYRRDTLGRKYPWALGRPANEVWAEIWDDIGPRIDTVLSTGQATWDEALLLFLERSGYAEETYHTFSYSPLRDDAAQVVGMLCVVSEETDRVIGERRMATLRDLGSDPSVIRTEQQVVAFADRQLARNSRDLPITLSYIFEREGAAALAGSTGIKAGHRAAPQSLPADDPSAVWPAGEVASGAAVVVDLDGDRFADLPTGGWPEPPVRALVVPLRQQGGTPYGFLVAALNRYRDLDEGYRGFIELVAGHLAAGVASARSYQAQQRRTEELAELDRAKTTFFSNISHEFRTPLTLIMGPVAELRGRADDALDAQALADLDVVQRNTLRLNKLVTALLDFSRIEAGRMEASYAPTDLAAATAELASMFESAIDRAGLRFSLDCPSLDEPVYLDRGMWEKVVFNLLSNALKFTFEGSIDVAVRRDDEHAVMTVADSGIGVPAAEMPRLFERFHRIENARARSHEGSGIGLALVRELVELHGGTIEADSIEGVGTRFTIRLPFGHRHLPVDAIESAGSATGAAVEEYVQEALRWLPDVEGVDDAVRAPTFDAGSGHPVRVVVADDNADMRHYLDRLLTATGYQTTVVSDGQQALDAIRADPPDLVVSDVMMPGVDGLALVTALRGDPVTAAVPVLLLSARAGQESSIEGMRAGADDYLVKPFAAAEVLARVRARVELARLRTHHARWRTALVDSLQEAFFICDENGAVIEINTAFTDILGYGPEHLPYEPLQPWWPDAETDPEAHRQVAEAFDTLLRKAHGSYTIPVQHRDGHRLWVTATFNHAEDPDTGRRVTVGTFRDVTAEHYSVRRQAALAALNGQLARATAGAQALSGALAELRAVWQARHVLGVTFATPNSASGAPPAEPELVCAGEQARWPDLPDTERTEIASLRDTAPLTVLAQRPGTAGIALRHPQGILVVWIELAEQRRFTVEDETLLTMLAGQLGQGLARVHQLDQQRETALALQHAILGPERLPSGFAVRYQPASQPLQVGGDWYDVVDLEDGRIGLVVGDCVGHGLAAATVMGQLRSACRALLLEHPSPGTALAGLDRFAARLPGAECTTAFCAVLDPDTGELVYSTAGHPPPIVAHPDGSTTILQDGRDIPLGLRPGRSRPEARAVLPPRATLLLYTDGLVERRRRSLDEGITRAADLIGDGRTSAPDELAGRLMSTLAPTGGYEDDVALLLYRQPAPLELELPADAGQLAPVRSALRGWLARCGLDSGQAQSVLFAANEAITNAIEHGHRDTPGGIIRLRATAMVDRLHVAVTDSGSWKPPQPVGDSRRGRGVALMRALMHEVIIQSGTAGTTVHLHTRIA